MRKRPTFAQIEMAKMRKRREQEELQKQRTEDYFLGWRKAADRARHAEARAIRLANSETIKMVVKCLTEDLGQDAARALRKQFDGLDLKTSRSTSSPNGTFQVISLHLPEQHINFAIPEADLRREWQEAHDSR